MTFYSFTALHLRSAVLVVVAGTLAGSACVDATPPIEPAGFIDLRASVTEPASPGEALFLAGSTPAELDPEGQATVERILAEPELLLQIQQEPRFLDQIEVLFLQFGRSFELADAYRELVDEQGDASSFRPRLALIYQRLGQYDIAQLEARGAAESRPDDPLAHYVLAMTLYAQRDLEPAYADEAREAYRRVLALDPNFVSPEGLSASAIGQRINARDADDD